MNEQEEVGNQHQLRTLGDARELHTIEICFLNAA